ncbi:alpha/beta hydrolase family protein [Brevundimonas sp. TWP1-2-1b1]|uniref:alpha/beta hydrolase family protein n=1 Tax=unclassified Brevundimonas TaxID=2622653 RepID=UPI003CEADFCB
MTSRFKSCLLAGLIPFILVAGGQPSLAGAQVAPAAVEAASAGLTPGQQAIADRAAALGATDIDARPGPNGGLLLGGKLSGAQFALAFPATWNGDGLVYAHGYSTPGTPVSVADNPVEKPGVLKLAYDQGFVAGHSAYDKAGLGVETGSVNTLRLRDLVAGLGGQRIYVAGDSMGGGIVVNLLETHPEAFVGGLARCGVVNSWRVLLDQLLDMRVAYAFLTRGTPYAYEGDTDVRRSVIAPEPPAGLTGEAAQFYVFGQMMKVAAPPLALWAAAQANPQGPEARIVRQVTTIGGFDYDAASLAYPLVTATLASEDLTATAGGWVYGNEDRDFSTPDMTPQEAAAINAGVQRVRAAPEALAYLDRWHTATGRVQTPLITFHNEIDSLVPYAQEEAFAQAVARTGSEANVAQYAVPAVKAPLPGSGVEGYTHCGFDMAQTSAAWTALRTWVETGARPATDAVR